VIHRIEMRLLLILAAMTFFALLFGGAYLHDRIHPNEEITAHDQCLLYQLQAVVCTVTAVAVVLFLQLFVSFFSPSDEACFHRALIDLRNLRAPPFQV